MNNAGLFFALAEAKARLFWAEGEYSLLEERFEAAYGKSIDAARKDQWTYDAFERHIDYYMPRIRRSAERGDAQ